MSFILDLKKFLAEQTFADTYQGDLKSESVDQDFIDFAKQFETKIAKAINNNAFIGLIVSNNKINNIKISDIKNSISLIKSAQAVYDNLVPAKEMMEPTAIVLINNPSKQLEEPDPANNQRQGITNDVKLPTHMDPLKLDGPELENMDARVEWMMSLNEK